jgi:hypothetical protein
MGDGDLLTLTLLFGVWLAAVACVAWSSVRREAGGRPPGVRGLTRRTGAAGVGLVAAYLSAALAALQTAPTDTRYSIIVAAFAAAMTAQGVQFSAALVRARRLRVADSRAA